LNLIVRVTDEASHFQISEISVNLCYYGKNMSENLQWIQDLNCTWNTHRRFTALSCLCIGAVESGPNPFLLHASILNRSRR